MTGHEAEAFMLRMERVWKIEDSVAVDNEGLLGQFSDSVWRTEGAVALRTSTREMNRVSFFCYLAQDIHVQVVVRPLEIQAYLYWEKTDIEMSYRDGKMYCYWTFPEGTYEPGNLVEQFARQWTDTFRRGCWLSGSTIEATAHEKVEWMQGFTREEIEAWNLKM